jgi:transmembrane sensor
MTDLVETEEGPPSPLQAATIWRMRRGGHDWSAADEAAFEAWLAQDELHRRAYERTGKVWDLVDSQAATPDVMVIRRDALHRAQRTARSRMARWDRGGVNLSRRGALAAAAGIVAVAGVATWPLLHLGEVYQTGLNERRVVTLADGSRLSLDAMTKVSVHYTDEARRLTLVRGQARFDVAHDVARPFSVRARDRTVVATGTAFNIDVFGDKARVTLIEGRVIVMPAKDDAGPLPKPGSTHLPPRAVELRAGQQLVAALDAPAQVVGNVDLQQATAWQQGKLMFDREPLAEAVDRMNRYSARKLVIGDPAAGAVEISGAFDAGDTRGFLEAVTTYLPITATPGEDGVTLRSSPTRD